MNNSEWQGEIGPAVRVIQIIVGSLIAGVVTFGVVAVIVGPSNPPAEEAGAAMPAEMLTYVSVAFAVTVLIARMVVGQVLLSTARRKIASGTWQAPQGGTPMAGDLIERAGDAGRLLVVLNTKTIVESALLEGAAFFALIAHLLEGTWLSLVLAAVLALGIAMGFPTAARVQHWIEDQLQLVEQERQFGR